MFQWVYVHNTVHINLYIHRRAFIYTAIQKSTGNMCTQSVADKLASISDYVK